MLVKPASEQVHPTYEALLADPAIDAIYNPLPNNLHAAWSIRAVDAGKHVLCEKPLATSAADARAMFDAARRNGVYLVEAYPYRAQPQTLKMRELLAAKAIGRLQSVQASFGFLLEDASNIRMNPALAGRRIDGRRLLSDQPGPRESPASGPCASTRWRAGPRAALTARWSHPWNSRAACWPKSPAVLRRRGIGTHSLPATRGRSGRRTSMTRPPRFHRCWKSSADTGWDAQTGICGERGDQTDSLPRPTPSATLCARLAAVVGGVAGRVDRHRADAGGARDQRAAAQRRRDRSVAPRSPDTRRVGRLLGSGRRDVR